MEVVRIYKDMEVSYQEFENALLQLGYHKVIKHHARLYVNELYDSVISLSHLNTPDRMMIRGAFSSQAYLMEMKGVLENRDDIAKMIEQDRLAQSAHGQTPQSVAA
jgi:predicted urease superfamily metal-dependent hydrolase